MTKLKLVFVMTLVARGEPAAKAAGWREAVRFYVRSKDPAARSVHQRCRDLLPLTTDPSALWSQRFLDIPRCLPDP